MVIVAGMEPCLYDATMTAAVPGHAVMLVRWNRGRQPVAGALLQRDAADIGLVCRVKTEAGASRAGLSHDLLRCGERIRSRGRNGRERRGAIAVAVHIPAVLADIGVTRASLGVQDLSAHVQNAIGRVQPFSVVQRAAETLREANIGEINVDLMYGLPNQSVQDIRRTVMLVHELKPQRLAVFGYAHVPWFKRHQKLLDESSLPAPAARIDQSMTAHETLVSLGYEPIGLDHYAAPADGLAVAARTRMLRRNFQGYTTDDAGALIGIGTSAIGQLPQGYVQNAPDTANYSRAITAGRFSTARGIALSIGDRVRGRIIEELMCHLDCDIGELQDQYNEIRESFEQELEALGPFTADGLVRIDGSRVTVEEGGRPYLRLIASTFDAYLSNSHVRHSVAV